MDEFVTESGRTPERVCREAADYFDTIDRLFEKIRIYEDDEIVGTVAVIAGRDDEVQRELRDVADWITGMRSDD